MSHLLFCISKASEAFDGGVAYWQPNFYEKALAEVGQVNASWEILDTFKVNGNRAKDWAIGLVEIVIDGPRDDSTMQAALESDNQIFIFSLEGSWRTKKVSSIPVNIRNRIANTILGPINIDPNINNSDDLSVAIDKLYLSMGFGSLANQIYHFNANHGTNYSP